MKVIIIDDKKAMHFIMERLLAVIEGVEVVGSFVETTSAYGYIRDHEVDLAFVDIEMPHENGLAFAKRLREAGQGLKLVFVTSHKEFALPAFEVYAYDYLIKPVDSERLRETVRRAISERLAPAVASSQEPARPLADDLTRREVEVLRLISEGLSNKEIAQRLFIIEGTVKNHIANLFGKLDVKNRVQAVAAAREQKLLP
ncbi:response regulator [Paenibacillus sp. 1P07SE]|uniref:response regulator n=1 Tax=Paenibacillus sp. 1P07SE TaxID=3132209 RepID=UPI0039A61FDC